MNKLAMKPKFSIVKTPIVMVVGLIAFATIAFSCSSDIEKVQELNDAQNVPSLHVVGLDGRVTEKGQMRIRFSTPELLQYHFAAEKHTDFPKGIKLYRYKDSVNIEASIEADRAVNYEDKSLWEATGNVKMRNAKGELLETEKLFWDQRTKKIYTDAWVRITRSDAIINGQGLVSDEAFDSYEIQQISGTIYVETDKNANSGQ